MKIYTIIAGGIQYPTAYTSLVALCKDIPGIKPHNVRRAVNSEANRWEGIVLGKVFHIYKGELIQFKRPKYKRNK